MSPEDLVEAFKRHLREIVDARHRENDRIRQEREANAERVRKERERAKVDPKVVAPLPDPSPEERMRTLSARWGL